MSGTLGRYGVFFVPQGDALTGLMWRRERNLFAGLGQSCVLEISELHSRENPSEDNSGLEDIPHEKRADVHLERMVCQMDSGLIHHHL